jgi:ABC-2 type transport system ATP-binding protein
MTDNSLILQLKCISKKFDEKLAVDCLSLDVPKGVIYGIIGPNGAGKTTTIRMIMNIIIPDSGNILFEGGNLAKNFRDKISYLPEERGLYKKMTCSEIIAYLASLKNFPKTKTKERTDYWLRRVELLDYKDRKVEELSKGMQQKLQFVTTIINEPNLLILDELFSGLDPLNMELIKEIILELKESGKTVLFSTHVMEQAEKLCDHICMISQGHKVLDGQLSDIKSKFGGNRIQLDIDGDGQKLRGIPGINKIKEYNNYIELSLEENTNRNELMKSILERVNVRRFDSSEPSLYNIFIDLAKIDPNQLNNNKGQIDE